MINESKPETKTVFKAIFAWEDEKEENWLEQMAADGWKLISVAPYVYKFQRSEPERVIFRLDYKNTLDKDVQEYRTLYKDTGWDLVGSFANWHYYRINPQIGETPEIYNSGKTKAQKYRRLLWGIFPIALISINPALRLLFNKEFVSESLFNNCLSILVLCCLLFMFFAVFRILIKIKKLENPAKE